MFSHLYSKVICWASHKRAPYYLAGVSFVESSIFPIPPDVMLVPMVLGRPLQAWHYAFITTVASVFGGLFGYLLGYFAFDAFGSAIIQHFGYETQYNQVMSWFTTYGWMAVLVAGITPIPYKIFTIAAGALRMPLAGFVLASILGRAVRFFLVAALVKTVGKKLETKLLKYVNHIGWGLVIIGAIAYLGYYVYQA